MKGRFARNHVVPTIFCVFHSEVSAAETWSFETNHDSMRSYFLDGNKDVKATHPTFSFFWGKPTTVFSKPFGYGSIVCRLHGCSRRIAMVPQDAAAEYADPVPCVAGSGARLTEEVGHLDGAGVVELINCSSSSKACLSHGQMLHLLNPLTAFGIVAPLRYAAPSSSLMW